jgi:CRISPR-associated exonuclease Cas4
MTLPDLNYSFDKILLDRQDKDIEAHYKQQDIPYNSAYWWVNELSIVGKYHPSSIPYCMRQTYYKWFVPKRIPAPSLRIMEAGNMTHEWIMKMLQLLVDEKQIQGEVASLESERPFEIVVDAEDDISIRGRFDDFLMLSNDRERYLIEVKSQKSLFYSNDYKKEHAIQAMPYLYVKRPCKGIFIYVDRASYETRIFPRDGDGLEYDKNVMSYIFTRVKLLDTYIKSQTLPPPEGKQIREMNWQCGLCPWKVECDAADEKQKKIQIIDQVKL